MAIHATCINGQGASTLSGSTITNTGMKQEDHMHISEDFVGPAGVVAPTDCAVAQSGTPGMSVVVAAGAGYILNGSYTAASITQSRYVRFKNSADVTVSISANGSGNPRITSIFAKWNTAASPDADATNVVTFVSVDGTPAASPTAPSAPADGNNYLRLANITVASGASSIVNANIADVRTFAMVNRSSALMDGQLDGATLSRTVATNALTFALLTRSGSAPSASDPIRIKLPGRGVVEITAAITKTLAAATAMFNIDSTALNAKDIFFFLQAYYRAASSEVGIGISRFCNGPTGTYADYSGTTTNEKYFAYSTSSAPASTDIIIPIGMFNAQMSSSGNWSIPSNNYFRLAPGLIETPDMTWAPSVTGFSSTTATTNLYKIRGNTLSMQYRVAGTSNATGFTFTLPFNSRAVGTVGASTIYHLARGTDNTANANTPSAIQIVDATSTATCFVTLSSSTWTASGTKGIDGTTMINYNI